MGSRLTLLRADSRVLIGFERRKGTAKQADGLTARATAPLRVGVHGRVVPAAWVSDFS